MSVTRVLCDKTNQCTADILIPYAEGQSQFSDTNSDWWATPLRLKFALKVTHPFEKRSTSTSQYSPTPPVIRLLYWSMRRTVCLPWVSYLLNKLMVVLIIILLLLILSSLLLAYM